MGKNKPASITLLAILHFFLGLSGLTGGVPLLLDPTGSSMGIPLMLLNKLPIANFLLPALVLVSFFGIAPIVIGYGLLKRPDSPALDTLNPAQKYHWSFSASIGISCLLIVWTFGEFILWGFFLLIGIYFALGTLILSLTLSYSTRKHLIKDTAG